MLHPIILNGSLLPIPRYPKGPQGGMGLHKGRMDHLRIVHLQPRQRPQERRARTAAAERPRENRRDGAESGSIPTENKDLTISYGIILLYLHEHISAIFHWGVWQKPAKGWAILGWQIAPQSSEKLK